MVDPISQQIIQEIGNKAVTQTPVEPSTVSANDATAFQDMVGATGNTQAPPPTAGVDGSTMQVGTESQVFGPDTADITSIKAKPSLGDRILQGLENTQNEIQTAKNNVAADLQKDGNINEMYKLQLQVSHLATNQHVVGQVGSKTSQGIQTLLKGQ